MTEKIQELLAVLDIPKDSPEQYGWLLSAIREHEACCDAYLAFRLRDEVSPHLWDTGMYEIYEHLLDKGNKDANLRVFGFWKSGFSKPIHWIIAALIAKELNKETNF